MEQLVIKMKSARVFLALYMSAILISFHYYFFYFINSTFMSQYFDAKTVGIFYTIAGIINVLILLNISKILRGFGNFKITLGLLIIEIACLLNIAFIESLYVVVPSFIISLILNPILGFNLDVFLENYSKDEETGGIRGFFLMAANIPALLCPFIVGLLLANSQFWKVYLIAALFLFPVLYIVFMTFKKFKDPSYSHTPLIASWKSLVRHKNIYNIFMSNLLLNLFYSWMVIYTPVYLYKEIGFSLPQIGALLSIMIIPFVIFQLPLGRLADKKYGEKEILISGFIIMTVTTLLIPYLETANFILWAIVLFSTRIGASFVEIAAETYFFKKISAKDTHFLGMFRMVREIPFIIVPFIVTITLLFTDMRHSFIVLALIMLLGLRYSFRLKDTL
jgi:MFS family permease